MTRAIELPSMFSQGYALMRHRIERCAKNGALRVPVEMAAEHVWAVVQGLVLSIVANPTGTAPIRQTKRAALDALFGALTVAIPSQPTDEPRQTRAGSADR
jgi:hypothetical protein